MQNKFKKIGLILSGGGSKGSFQLGAIDYLLNDLFCYNPFKLVCGTSIGSINGVKVSDGEFQTLKDFWFSIKSPKDIFIRRSLGLFGFLFGADSVYTLDPAFKQLQKFVSLENIRKTGREYQCSVYNTRTRKLKYISSNDTNLSNSNFQKYILGSCSIPGYFPPVEVNGNWFLDGGVRDVTPIKPAIQTQCDLIIVIRCSPSLISELPKIPSDIEILTSSIDSLVNEVYNSDIEKAQFINDFIESYDGLTDKLRVNNYYDSSEIKSFVGNLEMVFSNYRYLKLLIIESETEVMGTLDFYPDKIRHAYEVGYNTAKKAVFNSGINF